MANTDRPMIEVYITIRNHSLLKLTGFKPSNEGGPALVRMCLTDWLIVIGRRLKGGK